MRCQSVWYASDSYIPGELRYQCIHDAGHEGKHIPDDIPMDDDDLSDSDSTDLQALDSPSPSMAGTFALYPRGNTFYGVIHFAVPEDGGEIRGPVPPEFIDMLVTGKKPSAMQLAKMAMSLLAA